ncbi:ABC transporter ATP-binding protein [Pseudofrankia asymbiotica]|uniref:ABC transporter ATP-binding protein n=1 Tax=Pseudofrankia asymbiotica TaxID=1834516 RepID=A0A1V2I2C0_9ACTN|nr:ATP-binding cassette domain-containing protein [Pseudofrankia asymbiotica]ONH23606.1 ABC transporter ATP-binding protein [Pseudofrankia asymbiotica]
MTVDVGAERATTAQPAQPAQPLLSASSMSAGYGGVPVVRDMDLEVRAGEVVALLGANGAGKTTTLLALAGVLPISGGEVAWLGRTSRAPLHLRARAGLGFVPESRAVIPSLTTMENLRLGRGDPEAALELLPELKPLLKRRAGLLSGGEQQILTLARVLAAQPRLLLADEMSLGLAPMIVQRLLSAVRDAANSGIGVLIVEQQVRNVLAVADRAYVLRRGKIELEGKAAELAGRLEEIEATYLTGAAAIEEQADG